MNFVQRLSIFVSINLVAFILQKFASFANETIKQESWEFEPRVWAPNQQELDDIEVAFEEPDGDNDGVHLDCASLKFSSAKAISEPSISELRLMSNFWTTVAERRQVEQMFERQSSRGRRDWIRQQQQQDKCSQFRVDIRETVICDKKRCDKFDFEWPKYDNQIVHLQTTKHGMRFYRAEYAFASSRRAPAADDVHSMQGRRRETLKLTQTDSQLVQGAIREQVLANGRLKPVKFDLFELFKPKPTSPSTVAPVISPLPMTSLAPSSPAPSLVPTSPQQPDEPRTTTDTTEAPRGEQINSANQEGAPLNTTHLVTTFRINTRRRMQSMLGFGGALSDSTCRNIKSLSTNMAKSLMEDYFGQRGLRYNLARMTMGSSDFSTTPYTNNDKPEGPTTNSGELAGRTLQLTDDDVEMKKFRLVEEDLEFKLPIARQAIATSQQEIKFFSSLWSPPIWMKNNSNIVHGWLKGDVYGPYYKAMADYIVKWLEAYQKNGIEFWATTGLNEPVTGAKPFIFHNSLSITREDYVTFIKLYLGPTLRQRGLKNIKLIVLDDNKGYASQMVNAILKDTEAAKYVAGIGVHWYMNDEYENLNFIARDFPDKFLLSTEASNGYLPFQVHTLPGNWDRGAAYMYDMIKVIQKNAAGWVDWNMALDVGGGPSWAKNNLDSAVIVNAERDEYYKSPSFYAIGHFSKFVEPNSTRLDHRLANARYNRPLEAVAFYTPEEYVVIVVLNTNKHPVPFRVVVDKQLVRIVSLREESFNTIIFKWRSR